MTSPDSPTPPPDSNPESGYSLARRALEEARAAARQAGKAVGQGRASAAPRKRRARPAQRGWSGPRPDQYDPQTLGRAIGDLTSSRGWRGSLGSGMVLGSWESVVGADIASHATPTALRDKVLHIQAESTSWATQLRLMQSQILAKIAAAVGDGVVTSLRITGPVSVSWRRGPRSVPGRGPRDTYG